MQICKTQKHAEPIWPIGESLSGGECLTAHEQEIGLFQNAKATAAEKKRLQAIKAMEEANIPRRYASASMEAIKANMPSADNWVTDCWLPVHSFVNRLDANIAHGIGLLLYGARGRMKTTLAVAVLQENLRQRRGGYFVSMCSLIDTLRSKWDRDKNEADALDHRLRTTSLLILDDMGAEGIEKDWVLNKIQSIITDRYNAMKSTIITTNLTKDELMNTYTGRIIDRLRETMIAVEFTGKSFRHSLNIRGDDTVV